MRFISTKTHGVLDYISGILFIASPWAFGFINGGAAQWTPVIIGLMVLIMSALTNYEAGLVKAISMQGHLALDIVIGIFLLASPWIFGFVHEVYLPHVIFGVFAIFAGLFTQKVPKWHHRPIV